MRIERLHLLAYGMFRDKTLDFGKEPGFHLIYGPNEAGKSTTLRALSSVLFGYPHKVEDGYLYGSHDIRLGVNLVSKDGRSLAFIRNRQRKNPLILSDGGVLEEGILAAFLGGLSRETFEKVFSLNHERLRKHAQALISEGGGLGLGLAEAGSGISNLRKKLDNLSKERKEFFLPSGSKPLINHKISKLSEIRREIKGKTISPFEYKKYLKRIQSLEEALGEVRKTRDGIDREVRRNDRILRTLPNRSKHAVLSEKLLALADVEILPPEASNDRIKAESALDSANKALARVNLNIDDIQRQIVKITVDLRILDHEDEVGPLEKRSGAIAKSLEDLPRRERDLGNLFSRASALLQELGLPDNPDNLKEILPSLVRQKHISSLIDKRMNLEGKIEIARENEKSAGREFDQAVEELRNTSEISEYSDFEILLSEADRLGDISSEIEKGKTNVLQSQNVLTEKIRSLRIPSEEISHLREMVLPSDKAIVRKHEEFLEIQKEMKEVQSTLRRLEKEEGTIQKKIQQISRTGEVATSEDLEDARKRRDEGWDLIRGRYIEGRDDLEERCRTFAQNTSPADRFEELKKEADRLSDLLRTHASESVELELLKKQLELTETQHEQETQALTLCENRQIQFSESWSVLWPNGLVIVGPDKWPDRLPEAMQEWIKKREEILLESERIEKQKDETNLLIKKEKEAFERLSGTLSSLDPGFSQSPPVNLDSLRQKSRLILEKFRKLHALREKAEGNVRSLTVRKKQAKDRLKEHSDELEEWKNHILQALKEAGLPPSDDLISIKSFIETLTELNNLRGQIQDKHDQIEKMRMDHEGFSQDITRLSKFLDKVPDSTLETSSLLGQALQNARENRIKRSALEKNLATEKENKVQLEQTIRESESLLATLCRQAKCSNVSDLPTLETRSMEKQEVIRTLDELEGHILSDGSGLSIEELFAECQESSDDGIRALLEDLRIKKEANDKRLEQAVSELSTEKNALESLLGGGQAVDLVQEAEFLKAELEGKIEDYVALTLQEAVLRRSIEVYQDRNQGPILLKSGELFSALTEGIYKGVKGDSDEKGNPILLAEHAERGSLEISSLSDGTLDALYLALRLAAIDNHNALFEPVPFVADDLLINFDNQRAKATMKVLSDLAGTSQVLFFTHHAHMKDLARESVNSLTLKEHFL